jgi:hypothetical protein
MGWYKEAMRDMSKHAAAFSGFSGFDNVTADDFNRAVVMTEKRAIEAASEMDGQNGVSKLMQYIKGMSPVYKPFPTAEDRDEAWYDFQNYCDSVLDFIEDMQQSLNKPKISIKGPLTTLREAMQAKNAPSEADEIKAEQQASDRIERSLTDRIG